MNDCNHLAILGGGPAGLAVGYYARKEGIPFTIYEAGSRLGGNCITLKHGDFLFDSGAHRLHDQDAGVTAELRALLGDELRRINIPSLIYYSGKFVDFPLSPLNLIAALGIPTFARAAAEVVGTRLRRGKPADNFKSFAVRKYGRTIAKRFLLDYSHKLWGASCHRLSPNIAGKRMKGLSLGTFIKEALLGTKAKTKHLDGSFYYPRHGIGMIPEALASACGDRHIRKNAEITGIIHDGARITAVELIGGQHIAVGSAVSTLPLDRFAQMMTPNLPKKIVELTKELRYRHVALVALFLDRPSVTRAATLYFPGPEFPFTRVYEPRNRSPLMSPKGKTSLVVEIPCQSEDDTWAMPDRQLVTLVSEPLVRAGLIEKHQIMGSAVHRMISAYPVLEAGFEDKLATVMNALESFPNLAFAGRNGRFAYVHIHDLMRRGEAIVADFLTNGVARSTAHRPHPGHS